MRRVGHQRAIESREISGSDNDRRTEEHRYQQRPDDRLNDFAFHQDLLQEDFLACRPLQLFPSLL